MKQTLIVVILLIASSVVFNNQFCRNDKGEENKQYCLGVRIEFLLKDDTKKPKKLDSGKKKEKNKKGK